MVTAHVSSAAAVDDVVTGGVHCLELFVQLNWTGPPIEGLHTELEALVGEDGVRMLNQQALTALGSNGEVSSV